MQMGLLVRDLSSRDHGSVRLALFLASTCARSAGSDQKREYQSSIQPLASIRLMFSGPFYPQEAD